MSEFDDMIKRELEKEATGIDELLAADGGLPDMVAASFKGSMRRWVWFAWVIMFALTGLLIWTGYEFFVAATVDQRVLWGVCVLAVISMLGRLKMWNLMEMNRASTMREIKRLELAVAVLARQKGG